MSSATADPPMRAHPAWEACPLERAEGRALQPVILDCAEEQAHAPTPRTIFSRRRDGLANFSAMSRSSDCFANHQHFAVMGVPFRKLAAPMILVDSSAPELSGAPSEPRTRDSASRSKDRQFNPS